VGGTQPATRKPRKGLRGAKRSAQGLSKTFTGKRARGGEGQQGQDKRGEGESGYAGGKKTNPGGTAAAIRGLDRRGWGEKKGRGVGVRGGNN